MRLFGSGVLLSGVVATAAVAKVAASLFEGGEGGSTAGEGGDALGWLRGVIGGGGSAPAAAAVPFESMPESEAEQKEDAGEPILASDGSAGIGRALGMDHMNMNYVASSCNADLSSATCFPWSEWIDTAGPDGGPVPPGSEVKIPCGMCVVLDADVDGGAMSGMTLDLSGGLDIVGKLLIPAMSDVTIETPYVFVQGELVMPPPPAGTPLSTGSTGPRVKFLLTGTPGGGVTFVPDPLADNAGMMPKDVGTKAFVVAGGKVDVRAIDPACPGWVKLQSVTYDVVRTVNSDPTCETGLLSDGACCPAWCGQCGGDGCTTRPGGGDECCVGSILGKGRSCDEYSPPCAMPDPTCETGIRNGDACCAASCGRCGGSGCNDLPGGGEKCCSGSVTSLGRPCDLYPPPCSFNYDPADADPTCETGILNSAGACCPETCGRCGGSGCWQLPGGSENCCSSSVTSSGRSCDLYSPPCVISEQTEEPEAGPPPYDLLEVGEDAARCWSNPGGLILLTSDTFGYDDHHVAKVIDLSTHGITIPPGTIAVHPLPKKKTGVADTPDYPDFASETALLDRSLVIEGEDSPSGIGGHVIFLHTQGIQQHLEGVLLKNMGQEGNLGRYPLHFHMSEDVAHSTLAKNVIWSSNQRCIVIHGSHNATVHDNVAYDTKGHCFMTEDGGEWNNTFSSNLGAWTQRLPTLPKEGETDGDQPATFWITNPQNHFIGNVAAGSRGPGFWFELIMRGPSKDLPINEGISPKYLALGTFRDNTAHSNHGRWGAINTYESGYQAPSGQALFENTKSYKNENAGIFHHGSANIEHVGGLLADNGVAMRNFHHSYGVVDGLTVIGQSDHVKMLKAEGREHLNWCKAGGISFQPNQKRKHGTTVKNCHFSGFEDTTGCTSGGRNYALHVENDQVRHGVFNSAPTFFGNTFAEETKRLSARLAIDSSPDNDVENIAIEDVDGSLSGIGPGFFVQKRPYMTNFLADYNCSDHAGSEWLFFCPGACLRLVEVELSADLTTRGYTLEVTDGTNSGSAPRRDPWVEELQSHWTVPIGLNLPGGPAPKVVTFKDGHGNPAWPNFAKLYLENPPACEGSLGSSDIQLQMPPEDDARCADLFSKDDFASDPPIHGWQENEAGLEVTAMDGMNVVKTTSRKESGSTWKGLVRRLDTSCLAGRDGKRHVIAGKIRIRDESGTSSIDIASDGTGGDSPELRLKIEATDGSTLMYKSWHLATNGDGSWATFEKEFTLPESGMSQAYKVELSLADAPTNEFLVADWSLGLACQGEGVSCESDDECCSGACLGDQTCQGLPADPSCETGFINEGSDICCLATCGRCGGSGCYELDGGFSGCCSSGVLETGRTCNQYAPPCVVTVADPTCETGIIGSNGACCPEMCGQCGGSGCGNFPGGFENCCGSSVTSSGRSCDFYPPPCVLA